MVSLLCTIFILPLDPLHELIKGGSLMCTGGSQKCIDGSHGVKYSKDTRIIGMPFYNEEKGQNLLQN